MTDEQLAEKICQEINHQEILNKINEWGGFLSEKEKKELFEKGGIL